MTALVTTATSAIKISTVSVKPRVGSVISEYKVNVDPLISLILYLDEVL